MLATRTRRRDQGQDGDAPRIDGRERVQPGFDELDLGTRVNEMLNRWPAVGLAVGVVRGGRLAFFHGHGLADIASRTPITEDTVFRIASITKTFTAIAVMQLWEQGLVDLDAPANDYLRAYRLIPAKPGFRPATVRHLLTHTAGVPEELRLSDVFRPDFGESVELGQPLPTLAEYYRGGLRLVAEPGTRFIYTDHGFATLGQIVEDVSGQPFDRLPARAHLRAPRHGRHRPPPVRAGQGPTGDGLHPRPDGPRAVIDREWVTAGASSIYSTPRDMARYVAALLGGGTNEHGTVLEPATLASMFEPHYQPDPRVPGIGLAFSRFILGGHLAVEHEGRPARLQLADLRGSRRRRRGDRLHERSPAGDALAAGGSLRLCSEALLEVPDDAIRTDVPHHPEIWGDLCGWYRLAARLTDVRARLMLGAGAEVFVRGGRLMVRVLTPIPALYRGFPLHPDDETDPYVFRIDLSEFGVGTARVVFGREPGAGRRRSTST